MKILIKLQKIRKIVDILFKQKWTLLIYLYIQQMYYTNINFGKFQSRNFLSKKIERSYLLCSPHLYTAVLGEKKECDFLARDIEAFIVKTLVTFQFP